MYTTLKTLNVSVRITSMDGHTSRHAFGYVLYIHTDIKDIKHFCQNCFQGWSH